MAKLGISGVTSLTRARAEKLVASTTDMLLLAMFSSHRNNHVRKKVERKLGALMRREVPAVVVPKKARGPMRGADGKFLKKGVVTAPSV